MRDLKFNIPTRIRASRIETGKLENGKGTQYFEKVSVVLTKKGVVTVLQMDWATNKNKIIYTGSA